MTKKCFVSAANLIATISDGQDRKRVAVGFAILFKRLNKRFNSDRFFEACRV